MFHTASKVCSGEDEKKESVSLAREIAAQNGYGTPRIRGRPHGTTTDGRRDGTSATPKIPFLVPFISDEVSASLRKCLRRAGLEDRVTVSDIPPKNLKLQLIRNRLYDRLCMTTNCVVCPAGREGDCCATGVVYLILCRGCGQEYVGETARPLYVRVKEHLDGKAKLRLSTALGAHRIQAHSGADFEIEVKILAYEPKTSGRKMLEALWIHAKNPQISRKEECLAVTRELTPYLSASF